MSGVERMSMPFDTRKRGGSTHSSKPPPRQREGGLSSRRRRHRARIACGALVLPVPQTNPRADPEVAFDPEIDDPLRVGGGLDAAWTVSGASWLAWPARLRSRAAIEVVKDSMPSMTASKRIEVRRSNECWAPGSSA